MPVGEKGTQAMTLMPKHCRECNFKDRQIAALEAEAELLRAGPRGPYHDCRDCGRAMVWSRDLGSWMCPSCVMYRCDRAEAELRRMKEGEE